MKKLMGSLFKGKKLAPKRAKVLKKKISPKKAKKMVKKVAPKKVKTLKKKVSSKKVKVLKKKVAPKKSKVFSKKVAKRKLAPKKFKAVSKKAAIKSKTPAKQKTATPVQHHSAPVALIVLPKPQIHTFQHQPVLVAEILSNLELADKKVVVDGTMGLGGHSKAMLEKMPLDGKLIGFDVDDDNLAVARENLKSFGERVVFVRSNFSNLAEELQKLHVKSVDAILLDLGLSSPQVDNPLKGFSFLREGPLDMRFDKSQPLTAAGVINEYGLNQLITIFKEYGEEPFSRKIATEIVRRRKARSFKTTTELAWFIEKLIGRKGHLHPATRVFQALRIEVNHELEVLKSVLNQAVQVLKKNGRLAVISYHSLEDRLVKHYFKDSARDFINEPDKLTTTHLEPTLTIVTRKPIFPTEAEISKNPRSRSAKLRVAEKM